MENISDRLIAKYLKEECSEKEHEIIEHWLSINENNREKLEMARKIVEFENRSHFVLDTEKALKSVLERLPDQRLPKKIRYWSWIRIAALLVMMLGAGYLAIKFTRNQINVHLVHNQIKEDNSKIELPDGSNIWLRKGSKVVYPSAFKKKTREIRFSGEGYFDIISDPERPFVIESEGIITRVLGTKFTLNTTSKDSIIYLVLEEGKVEFAPSGTRKRDYREVKPGQLASIKKSDNKIDIRENDNLNYLSWKTKSYRYINQPIDPILSDIQYFYNIKFGNVPQGMEAETFNTEFDSLYTLDEVLNNIEIITESKIEKVGDIYYFKTKS